MADLFGLQLVTDEALPGLSEAFDREPGADLERRLTLLAEAAATQGVGAPAARGLPQVWTAVVDTLLRRRALQTLGPFEVPTHWISFHVPPGGKGQLKVANKTGAEFGLKLKAVGSGWGSGRVVTLNVNRDFQERTHCLRVALALSTRVTMFEGDLPPRADVLGIAGIVVEELATCPDCSGANELQGAMVAPAGEWIDLRNDPTGQTLETLLELGGNSDLNLSMPFKLPGLDVQIGIDWTLQSQLSFSTKYVFPGGRRYRPSSSYGEPDDLPYWRWE
jgi:hypothetical protein